jgi:TrmH family RNA methyltransferase
VQKRTLRWSEGVCVIEGPDLVDAALASGAEFEAIYLDASALERERIAALVEQASRAGVRIFALEPGTLDKVADSQTPQPVLAAVRTPVTALGDLEATGTILLLHEVRDPGNAGTIVRSADAAGVTSVVFTGHSVDPFNPKTLRASAGSIFHLPVAVASLDEALAHFTNAGARSFATVVRGGTDHRSIDFSRACVVVIGNEADGLDADAIAACDERVSIRMQGRSESLNAGVAASLIVFEAMWQRQGTTPPAPPPSL